MTNKQIIQQIARLTQIPEGCINEHDLIKSRLIQIHDLVCELEFESKPVGSALSALAEKLRQAEKRS